MKKTIMALILSCSLIFASCSIAPSSTPIAEPTPTPIATPAAPLLVTIDTPITIAEKPVVVKSVDNTSYPEFKYALVHETDHYYLHKLESWKSENGIIVFTCSICKNTIRIPEADVAMYKKIGINICWTANADVCGGEPADWYELLAEK